MKKKEQVFCNEDTKWTDCMDKLMVRVNELAKKGCYLTGIERKVIAGILRYRYTFTFKEDL
jgi:hypothetical protein